jgi:DNA polymerase (family X)
VGDAKLVERALEDIAVLLSFSAQGRFKAQAYERGAEIVASLSFELGPVIEAGRLTEIEGIGPSLSKQILELWSTGSSSLLERLRAENPPGAAELARVPGMTPKRIQALSSQLGITSVEALREACDAERVRALPGFGAKTEQRLREAIDQLARAAAREPRILLSDALVLYRALAEGVRATPGLARVELAGAARRGEETLPSLTMLAVFDDAAAVPARGPDATSPLAPLEAGLWDVLAALPQVVRVEREQGRALLSDGISLSVRVASAGEAGAALLHATGPETHVTALAERASAHGYRLDARGLLPDASSPSTMVEAPAARHEADIYRALGLHPVPAELRSADLALAERDDFGDLIDEPDIRGAVHCHTTHSDGKHSIEEMARAAQALGLEYITITDHSPSAYYAHGVTRERLQQQWDEIREVEQRVGIRILRGTESDILADGSLDFPDEVLTQFDVVIASIHSRLRMSRADMTTRLVRAMQQPVFKIWGHALGRLLLSREPIDCDVEAVLDALAASRGAIEINGDPHRLDLPPHWIAPARARNIPFVLSVDAHSTRGLGVLRFAVQMARRGGLRRHEVLNALPAESFVTRVRPG